MIKKIIKISGTGKFYDYKPAIVPANVRTINFEKINLLYGENGSGKTTLAIIFKSLKGNNNLLQNKRSFDTTTSQSIEILTDLSDPVVKFNNNAWNTHYPNLEVFDIHFINENIYTNLEIRSSNRKRLFEVVFGHQGVQLKADIQQIKENIQGLRNEIRSLETQIKQVVENAFEVESYCQLRIDAEINDKIDEKKRSIKTAKKSQEISTKNLLATIPLIDIPYDSQNLDTVLQKSISSISDAYLQLFLTHKSHLNTSMNGGEETWIKQGYEAITDKKCPFCQRQFDSTVKILESYNQYFNTEYNALLGELSMFNNSVSQFNLEAKFFGCESTINSNKILIEFWKYHVENTVDLESILDNKDEILEAFRKMKAILKEKNQKPTESVNLQNVVDFEGKVEVLNARIKDFNHRISSYNALITSLKQANSVNINTLKSELKKLIAIAKRAEPNVQILCNDLQDKKNLLNIEIDKKDTKQGQLNTHSTTIFTNYGNRINGYLQSFAPYLEIRNLGSSYVTSSKQPIVKFGLYVDGNEIKLNNEESNLSFKYTFSEGDKSALALSFFLAKLEIDGNMQDKVIIFDDPISSFDFNRKSTTINKLSSIGQRAKQLFVFTHNINFASEFWKTVSQLSLNKQCSRIEYIQNTSCLAEYDIENETLAGILKDTQEIKKYLDNGVLTDQDRKAVARCLRPVLESYFHIKFFDVVRSDDWLGNFISKVRDAFNDTSNKFNRLFPYVDKLTDINDFSKKYHRRFNTNFENEPINNTELRSYCEKTMDMIQLI